MTATAPRVVRILTTGGTIATTRDPAGRTAPTLDANAVAALAGNRELTIEARELARRPSWRLEPAEMARIAIAARDEAREVRSGGVVVTHGTTTLEYTAFLTDLVLDVDTPVVFTGSMRPADDPEPDGPGNLRSAIAVAAADAARGHGALVVFADRIIAARRAWKAHRSAADAFVDLGGEPGRVTPNGPLLGRPLDRVGPFSGRLETQVALVKAVPGADGALIRAAIDGGARGLVVEALPGAGGVPPLMADELRSVPRSILVAVASRAPYGRLPDEPTGGTGQPLLGLGLLSAGPLTSEAAWILLMAALGDASDADDATARFTAATAAMSTETDRRVDR